MTLQFVPTQESPVGEIAASLPGAAALFRDAGISFCCGGHQSVAEAAAGRGLDPAEILSGLSALAEAAGRGAPEGTEALIDHIEDRYHATHRRELAELIPLAEKVEAVHADHPEVPRGLSVLLAAIRDEMHSHMAKEEQILFPMMRAGGNAMIVHPIAAMRAEHDDHADQLRGIEHVTHGFALPDGACRSWQALYAGVRKFADDLVAHIHLENEILFPRFEAAA
jgi:regulator of cell morphogenesis and NO signaling